jgi:hypothetical protein
MRGIPQGVTLARIKQGCPGLGAVIGLSETVPYTRYEGEPY